MTDPVASTYLAVIGLCVLPLAYLLPQDPAVERLLAAVRRWVSASAAASMGCRHASNCRIDLGGDT
jgi:hypothetical protein